MSDSILIGADDAVDHQAGLFQTVKDISVAELRANTAMLAKLAALLDIPLITSASVPEGPWLSPRSMRKPRVTTSTPCSTPA